MLMAHEGYHHAPVRFNLPWQIILLADSIAPDPMW